MIAEIFGGGANDVITAVLVIAVGAVLRGLWTLQQRVARLEGLDEMRERQLDKDREEEITPP
jgi:uncharacterized membrane protein YqjE